MPAVGETTIPSTTIAPSGSDTVATLAVTRGDDTAVVVTATKTSDSDGVQTWTGDAVAYTVAGEWLFTWLVTGTGRGTKTQRVQVEPAPDATLTGEVAYATTADYATWLRTAPPAGARRALTEASRKVDEMVVTAYYDTTTAGLPTDPDIAAAMRDATCAQAEYERAGGDTNGVGAAVGFGSVSIGSVSLGARAGATAGTSAGRYSSKAFTILQRAGLTANGPSVW